MMSNLNHLPKAWAGKHLMVVAFCHTIAPCGCTHATSRVCRDTD